MATIDDVRAGVLESEVYEGILPGGERVELTSALLDLDADVLPFAREVRDRGAQAFGMLFFNPRSASCPKHGVMWIKFENGLELTAEDGERHFVERDRAFSWFCIKMATLFLRSLAMRNAKYTGLAPAGACAVH